jgi:hypothetical protein
VRERILFPEDDADFREIFTPPLREALAPKQLDVAFVETQGVRQRLFIEDARKGNTTHHDLTPDTGPPD